MNKARVIEHIDVTYLQPSPYKYSEFLDMVNSHHDFKNICTFSNYYRVSETRPDINVSCVVGFPYGNAEYVEKKALIELLREQDVDEIDFVLNPLFLEPFWKAELCDDITLALRSGMETVKFILECRILTDYNLAYAIKSIGEIVDSFGGNAPKVLLKNSTGMDWKGFSPNSFDVTMLDLLRMDKIQHQYGYTFGFKAAGGIKTLSEARTLLMFNGLNVERVGMSNITALVGEDNG